MATKASVSSEDLLMVKMEITEEQTKLRHALRGDMQRVAVENDDTKTDVALLKQSISTMSAGMEEMKTLLKDGFKEINKKFDDLPGKFVSKEDHNDNRDRIKSLEEQLAKAKEKVQSIDVKLAGWSTGIIVILFFFNQFISKHPIF